MVNTDFDAHAFFAAVDARRRIEKLSWPGVAAAIWNQSHVLNGQRKDHPISPATIKGVETRGDLTCQHALFLLRWLKVPPETFITAPQPGTSDVKLPEPGPGHRLRWDLCKLYGALDGARQTRGATWREAAAALHCTPNQLTRLRTAKFATGMVLAMRITQTLRKPAADFIYIADW
jgi:hypothetical protein